MAPPPSSSPSLHLDRRDARAAGKSSFRPSDSRRARGVWFAGAALAFAIMAFAVWQAERSDAASNPPITSSPLPVPAAAPPTPAPVPATTPTSVAPMVISPEEAAAASRPHVVLNVSSQPPGAAVIVRGKRVGITPGRFEWTEESGAKGPLLVQLKHVGYQPYTYRHALDAPELEISATLVPVRRKLDLPPIDVRSRPETNRGDGTDNAPGDSSSDDTETSEPEATPPAPEPEANASDPRSEP
jgi:PEGA domain-containing protein